MDEEGKERAREEHVRRMLSVVPSLSADKKHNSIEVILSCLALRRDHFFFLARVLEHVCLVSSDLHDN